jgi:hypothetical protein
MGGRLLVMLAVCACACPAKPEPTTAGGGSGGSSATAGSATAGACDAIRAHVAQLYGAELANPALVDDNTAMVMKDCAKQPDRVAGCAAGAKTVAELEHNCLIPLDAEGTEGDQLKR